jgi:hypothetical protein
VRTPLFSPRRTRVLTIRAHQITPDNPCGFCGISPPCPVYILKKSRTKYIASDCPDFHECKYGAAIKSSNANPSTNIPIICTLCPPDRTRAQQPAIWKYNMDHHLRTRHIGYAIPGWPAREGAHDSRADEPGHRLPSEMAGSLLFDEEEEERLGVARSTPWDQVGMVEKAAVSPAVLSATATRRDAVARLQTAGFKRQAEGPELASGSPSKRTR